MKPALMKLYILWLNEMYKAVPALLASCSRKGISYSEVELLIPPLAKIPGWPKKNAPN